MLFALVAPETPPAAIANTSAARATKPTATNFRLFIDEPSIALAGLELQRPSGARLGSADWSIPVAIPGEGSHTCPRMSRPIISRPAGRLRDGARIAPGDGTDQISRRSRRRTEQ